MKKIQENMSIMNDELKHDKQMTVQFRKIEDQMSETFQSCKNQDIIDKSKFHIIADVADILQKYLSDMSKSEHEEAIMDYFNELEMAIKAVEETNGSSDITVCFEDVHDLKDVLVEVQMQIDEKITSGVLPEQGTL